ncbi:hypothetical protein [Polyangium aurulentum]|uniref:hypothetical protein n=1 Tax=Polyangium aurulentum TaxID=2567896 RepID=UPI00146D3FE9|nr:hypothetical protein [Polyangium aurulentum]UQA64068.1 hypothetical protein E8A73_005770 [Polyangium aurulentum]
MQCPSCSLHKADKTTGVDPETGQAVTLFHPLQQNWQEHFRLEPDGTCSGLTAVGRATVVALAMNVLIPRFARACQLALGLLSTT